MEICNMRWSEKDKMCKRKVIETESHHSTAGNLTLLTGQEPGKFKPHHAVELRRIFAFTYHFSKPNPSGRLRRGSILLKAMNYSTLLSAPERCFF